MTPGKTETSSLYVEVCVDVYVCMCVCVYVCRCVDVFSRNKVLKGGSILFHVMYILLAVTGEDPIRPLNIVVNKKKVRLRMM